MARVLAELAESDPCLDFSSTAITLKPFHGPLQASGSNDSVQMEFTCVQRKILKTKAGGKQQTVKGLAVGSIDSVITSFEKLAIKLNETKIFKQCISETLSDKSRRTLTSKLEAKSASELVDLMNAMTRTSNKDMKIIELTRGIFESEVTALDDMTVLIRTIKDDMSGITDLMIMNEIGSIHDKRNVGGVMKVIKDVLDKKLGTITDDASEVDSLMERLSKIKM